MCPGIICRHWQQICCSSRLYDGLFGEGCLRASANQARVLTWRPGHLEFELRLLVARVHAQIQTTRETFSFTSSLFVFCFTTPVPFLSAPRLQHPSSLNSRQTQLQRVAAKDTCTDPTASPSINMAYRIGTYIHSPQYYNALRDLLLIRPEISATKQAGCQATQCKKENVKIQKGEIRQGVLVTTGDFQSMKWRHW